MLWLAETIANLVPPHFIQVWWFKVAPNCHFGSPHLTSAATLLEMHLLFITIANIHPSVHMKATSHAWACIGYIPAPELEQQMIACVAKSASPVTMAKLDRFGDGVHYPPCEGKITLQILYDLCAGGLDPWWLQEFLAAAKAAHLSSVQLPFWWDWQFLDPSIFLVGEILHALLKLFFDHPFKWCKELLGTDKLDTCYHTQHKCIGVRHFKKVLHMKQMTRWDHWDLACTIVAMIAGTAELLSSVLSMHSSTVSTKLSPQRSPNLLSATWRILYQSSTGTSMPSWKQVHDEESPKKWSISGSPNLSWSNHLVAWYAM